MQYSIRVKPGSRKGPLVEPDTESDAADFVVHVRERAVDGAANDGVVRALAAHFGVPPRDVTILRGQSSRIKRIDVDA
ncbi:MAG: hypothetical protein ABS63_09865 [Microbacterium sp. SCN 70-27]|uniref:DUF167 domain-containing protein n=1 Tax=unclassified Microbacterium TaxID=2609290 RepID=UPI00086BDC11|nr:MULTISPECIES: DUF167 domain-containing protein [unclassified Microbacterium]MBN9224849.1 DUF167 domain-containing protein [Microbacterium sp.]ODT27106.1 MAG: hypothetical protein ABS63_09865 [Microbacterium sp. SCN 70-27]